MKQYVIMSRTEDPLRENIPTLRIHNTEDSFDWIELTGPGVLAMERDLETKLCAGDGFERNLVTLELKRVAPTQE